MGTTVTKSGVSVQFCNRDGDIEGPPVFSTFVQIQGRPRGEVIDRGGRGQTDEERIHHGSEDWLTLIAIADSDERLCTLVKESGIAITTAQTSGSSRRVQVEMHVGGIRRTLHDRITIASGPIIQSDPPIMNVFHIKVLGEGTRMNPDHPLWKEFFAQTPVR